MSETNSAPIPERIPDPQGDPQGDRPSGMRPERIAARPRALRAARRLIGADRRRVLRMAPGIWRELETGRRPLSPPPAARAADLLGADLDVLHRGRRGAPAADLAGRLPADLRPRP